MIRLDRWLVLLALGSRSQVQPLIRAGRVRVNGAVCRDPGQSFDEGAALTLVDRFLNDALDGMRFDEIAARQEMESAE